MTYEEKFELIVKAIAEAKKYAREEYYPKLYYNEESGLKGVDLNQIHDILLQFQDDDKIITVKDTPTALKSGLEQATEGLNGAKHYFTIDILDGFDEWYKKRLIKSKSRLQNLDYINLLKIYDVVLDIDQKVQIEASDDIYIPALPTLVRFPILFPMDSIGTRDTYRSHRHEGLNYLEKEGIISDVEWVEDIYYGNFSLTVNMIKFQNFLKEITEEYKKRNKTEPRDKTDIKKANEDTKKAISKQPEEKSDVVYEITYTKQRQILMNNAQIGRPDFNSENDLVFSFLYGHPNEGFTKEQIEKAVGGKLNKSLHKIIENLGFEGDTKEVFISVSKNAIQFRNPITKKDLEEMKKPTIKLIKGGGKLILPH